MRSNQVNMLSGPITKGLILLTVPIMVMNVLQTLFNIVDMTILRIFSNDKAVGAVGACGVLIALFTSLMIGISVGANVIVARRIGSGNKERADRAATTAVLFSIAGGIVLMILGILFSEVFLKWTNCPESLLPKAVLYFRIYFFGVPILMFYNFCASVLRATGDTKRPMIFLISGGIVKVLVTLILAILGYDVAGVGLATVISHVVASVLIVFRLRKIKHIVCIDFKKMIIDRDELKEILRIGVPAGIQSSMYSMANAVITAAVNSFGEAATTGVSIANQFDGILYHIAYAPSLAVTPYVSQNMGTGNYKRIKDSFLRAVLITTAFAATFGFLSAAFSESLSSIMSSTPEVIAYSRQKMIIISSTYFICGINDVIGGVLRGIGKSVAPTVTALIFTCALRFVWVYAVFPLFPNLTFLYAVWPIGWILSIITQLVVYFVSMKNLEGKAPCPTAAA